MTLYLAGLALYGLGAGATARTIEGHSLTLDMLAWALWPAVWTMFVLGLAWQAITGRLE